MKQVRLIEPPVLLREQFVDFMSDWNATGEQLVPFVLAMDYSNYQEYIQKLKNYSLGIGLPDGFVPHSTFWLIYDDKIIGVSNLRHSLTDKLLKEGGNIGYGIRPTERQKGYATILLQLTLEKARAMGLSKVLLTCDKDNVGSVKTILNNNGVLDSEEEINGKVHQRYWIELSRNPQY
ncbi:MAG: GNAT family N-acetyltransferase [bacterium]|nr:GNAT family N-acetyltransferase [bacterium]